MSNFSRGSSMDYSPKFGPQQRGEWVRRKPQKSSSSFRQPAGQNLFFGESDTSRFKTRLNGARQQFSVGLDSFHAPDVLTEQYDSHLPWNSFSQLQSDFSESDLDSSSKYDDGEIFSALVNKILEDDGDRYTDKASVSQFPWNTENESIGELAIKLADLNILENEIKMEPDRRYKPDSSSHNGRKFYEKYEVFCQEPPIKMAKNDFSAAHSGPANILLKNPSVPKRKNDFFIKKKKFMPWNCYSQNPNNFKDPRKPSGHDGYGLRASQKQGFRDMPPAASVPQAFRPQAAGQKGKCVYPKYTGPVHYFSNDTKSDSSSGSSSSSVYKDYASRTSTDSFNCKEVSELNYPGRGSFTSRQPRRFRKTHSTASSSSGGKTAECVFCKTNGETSAIYRGHVLKDDQGRTVCRVLQQYICPLCGATGFNAHTVKYCPKNENPPPIATMTTLKSMRSSTGRRRHGPCSGQIRPISAGFNRNLLPA